MCVHLVDKNGYSFLTHLPLLGSDECIKDVKDFWRRKAGFRDQNFRDWLMHYDLIRQNESSNKSEETNMNRIRDRTVFVR